MYDGRHQAAADHERARKRLRQEAESALTVGPFSVMDKPLVPPSGDKHDYMSFAPYWWPNLNTPDGLPYIRRDGEVNPQRDLLDNKPFKAMVGASVNLARAARVLNKPRYAERAAFLLRVWFLDQETRMNPHLEFGQAILGICHGRGIGIIDTATLFPDLLDALADLEAFLSGPWSPWTDADRAGMRDWLNAYLDWSLTSDHGLDEARQHNNHGTWYDAQNVALALFLGRVATAREILETVPERRIRAHIRPDGSQPHELARTRSFSYSVMNLRGLFYLAEFGERLRLGLWRVTPADDPDSEPLLSRALSFLLPAALGQVEWPYPQITPFDSASALLPLTQTAARVYLDSDTFLGAAERLMERLSLLPPHV
jgi:hypothetical protein